MKVNKKKNEIEQKMKREIAFLLKPATTLEAFKLHTNLYPSEKTLQNKCRFSNC